MKNLIPTLLVLMAIGGCANQLHLKEGDASIALLQIDTKAGAPFASIEADGCVMIFRGHVSIADVVDKVVMTTPTCSFGDTRRIRL